MSKTSLRLCHLTLLFLFGLTLCSCSNGSESSEGDVDTDIDQTPYVDGDSDPEFETPPSDGDDEAELEAEQDEIQTECIRSCASMPREVTFDPVAIGESGEVELLIESVGSEDLVVSSVFLREDSDPTFSIYTFIPYEPEISVEPGSRLIVVLHHNPVDGTPQNGILVIQSNDDLYPEIHVRISATQSGSVSLEVVPESLVWESGILGDAPQEKLITIRAIGDTPDSTRPMEITRMTLEFGDVFSLVTEDSAENLCVPPFFISAGQERNCGLIFDPPTVGEFTDSIEIRGEDGVSGIQTASVALSGTGYDIAVEINPDRIDFGHVLVTAGVVNREVSIINQGSAELQIISMIWRSDSSDDITNGDPNNIVGNSIEAGNTAEFTVFYNPTRLRDDSGVLEIVTNSRTTPMITLEVTGKGIIECPPGFHPGEGEMSAYCECTPGDTVCWNEGDPAYRICNDDGLTLGEIFDCPGGYPCEDGTCGEAPECEPFTLRCVDETHEQRCSADGSRWEDPVLCVTTENCRISLCLENNCEVQLAQQGSSCDDFEPCTENDSCNEFGDCQGTQKVCDDENDCTDDICVAGVGCQYEPDNLNTCDDGNPCTSGDHCEGGICVPGQVNIDCDDGNICTDDFCDPEAEEPCSHIANDRACNDGNRCTINDVCVNKVCTAGPDTLDCDDEEVCTADSCDPDEGCVNEFSPGPCDDGDPCTVEDYCGLIGTLVVCHPGDPLDCDDNNPCTVDSCDGLGGCAHDPLDAVSCENGDACTENDMCIAGECVAGDAVDCDDDNVCTDDSCVSPSGCQHVRNNNDCDDGDPCTIGDYCDRSECEPGLVALNCDDDNPCTFDYCETGQGCGHFLSANGTSCDDGNACTSEGSCQGGICEPGELLVDCDDHDVCTRDSCTPGGGCLNEPVINFPCDDGNACTVGDYCNENGICAPGNEERDCEDGNPCRSWSCLPESGCQYSARGGSCEDGNPCSSGDMCQDGFCSSGSDIIECSDDNVCTSDSCMAYFGCSYENVDLDCEDDNACTIGDSCVDGVCVGGSGQPDCEDDNPCTADYCDPDSGCVNDDLDGEDCEEVFPCTLGDVCVGRNCVPGQDRVSCVDGNPCTEDLCHDEFGCRNLPDNTLDCDDGNECTVNDYCSDGVCMGNGLNCNDDNPCTIDSCDVGSQTCIHVARSGSCDDGSICTINDSCVGDACEGEDLDCSDYDDQCSAGYCDEEEGCMANTTPFDGDGCDDGDPCTVGDGCNAGICAGSPKDCSALDGECTMGVCNPSDGQCYEENTPDYFSCGTDGLDCTDDVCISGECVHPDSPNGVSCNNDFGACYQGLCARVIDQHSGMIHALRFTRDGLGLFSGGQDDETKLLKLNSYETIDFEGHSADVRSLATHPAENLVAAGSEDASIRVWSYQGSSVTLLSHIILPSGHYDCVSALDYSPAGSFLASGSYDRSIKIWNHMGSQRLRTLPLAEESELNSHTASVRALAYSPDGLKLASAAADHSVKVWSVDSGQMLQSLHGHGQSVFALAYHPGANLLASAGEDGSIIIWDTVAGSAAHTLPSVHGTAIMGLAWIASGEVLASASTDGALQLREGESGDLIKEIDFPCAARSMDASDEAGLLAIGCSDGSIRLFAMDEDLF